MWLGELPHAHKVVVEGNHECKAPWKDDTHAILTNATFLRNEAVRCPHVARICPAVPSAVPCQPAAA